MKKLMIAAAVAAMVGGAFADAMVYDIKISGKKAVTARGKVQAYAEYYTDKDDKDGDPITKFAWFKVNDGETVCYRKSGSFTWDGVLAGCECDNDEVVGPFANFLQETSIAALWEKKAKAEVPAAFTSLEIIRSGAKTDFVEAWIEMTAFGEEFYLAGQGKFDAKKGYLTTISGNFVGKLPVDPVLVEEDGEDCSMCKPGVNGVTYNCYPYDIELCAVFGDDSTLKEDTDIWVDNTVDQTFAYGKWTVKYSSSKSKALNKLVPNENNVFTADSIEKALKLPAYVNTIDFPAKPNP